MRKSDTFLSVVSVNQESASGQVNPVDIVDVAYFWYMLIPLGDCSVKLS